MPIGAQLNPATAISLSLFNGSWTVFDDEAGETSGNGIVRETFSRQWSENQGERRLMCAWQDRVGVAMGLTGGAAVIGSISAFNSPALYPAVSWWPCQRVECSGHGIQSVDPVNGMIAFQYAKLRVMYGPDDTANLTAGELSLDFATTAIALDQTTPTYRWSSDHFVVPPSQAPTLCATTILATLLLLQRPQLNQVVIANLVDQTNSGTFQGFGAGRVIFRGGRSNRRVTVGGVLNYDLSLSFEISGAAWNWNQLWRAGTGWATYETAGGAVPFPGADFTPLLQTT